MRQTLKPYMQLIIGKADNGYVVTYKGGEGEIDRKEHYMVYQEQADSYTDEEGQHKAEQEALLKMFLDIKEYLGVYYSKHRIHNLVFDMEESKNE